MCNIDGYQVDPKFKGNKRAYLHVNEYSKNKIQGLIDRFVVEKQQLDAAMAVKSKRQRSDSGEEPPPSQKQFKEYLAPDLQHSLSDIQKRQMRSFLDRQQLRERVRDDTHGRYSPEMNPSAGLTLD